MPEFRFVYPDVSDTDQFVKSVLVFECLRSGLLEY